MDESWKRRMGIARTSSLAAAKNNPTSRRSTEDISNRLLEPEDFKDVFGGPPRTVISRQFSTDYFPWSSTASFYEEIFRPMGNQGSAQVPVRSSRNLPEFRIPGEKGARRSNRFDGLYSDIFGWHEEQMKRSRTRSRSKSKTSSSSVLSSEDLSPLRPAIGGTDRDVSLFASKLRPINVPRRWNANREMHEEEPLKHPGVPSYQSNSPSHYMEYDYMENFKSTKCGLFQRNLSPETISLDQPNSYGSFKASVDDLELNSPASVVSSLCQTRDQEEAMACSTQNDEMLHEEEDEEDEVISSHVIEISGDHSQDGKDEGIGVDDAIAWAKEKFQTHSSIQFTDANECSDGNESIPAPEDEESHHWLNEDEKQQMETRQMAMELLDEKIRLWSTGKEADIRLLLSTLHHILWADSGWLAVPLADLIESSQVKKAYQKARLFLHPDKLQQRGATFLQKYVADKAFPVLQDAWAAFVSQDVL